MSSFSIKSIEVRMQLSSGSFAGGGDVKIIRGLPVDASIDKIAAPDINKAQIRIMGMKLDDMANLTTLSFMPLSTPRNVLELYAGENSESSLPLVFSGEITLAFADFSAAPDIIFDVTAMTGSYPMQIALAPTSVKDSLPVADVISKLADSAGYSFRNEGVSGSLKNAVLSGSPLEQIYSAARQVGAKIIIDDNSVILIPIDKPRSGEVAILSDDSGLIGYPSFNNTGIVCKCLYNPNLKIGGAVQIKSVVPKATGQWMVTKLTHSLSAYNPRGGEWSSNLEAAYV